MNPRKICLPDLNQLLLGELSGAGGVVIVEPLDVSWLALDDITIFLRPVSVLKPFELVAHKALEGRAKECPVDWNLGDSADEEIDVVGVGVDQLQPLDNLLGDEVGKVVKTVDFFESTDLTECIVSGQSVVPTPLDIQCNKVHPKAVVLGLEEVVRQLFTQDVVKLLSRLCGKTH